MFVWLNFLVLSLSKIFAEIIYNHANIFFFSARSGKIRVLSFKVGILLLCNGHLDDKYKCK